MLAFGYVLEIPQTWISDRESTNQNLNSIHVSANESVSEIEQRKSHHRTG